MPLPARPKQLGHYEVVAKIAGGGMATVYMGRTPRREGRDGVVALKVIRPELSKHEDVVAMFLDEANILQRLSHPNITRTYEYGIEGEQHYLAMELLLGRTLLDLWETSAARGVLLPFDLSAWIAARVATGLHHAHELRDEAGTPLSVIHRDVNPSNIFLTYDGEVKLFDFGLAKAVGRRAKTAAGIVKGKLPYLAPEQIMQFPLDRRCDVFALGTTLWELTTMRRLFKREDDVETVKAVRGGPIPDGRQLVPGYPEELWRIVRKSLERNRDHRHATTEELARELDAFVAPYGPERMPARMVELVDRTFPGDRARQTGWLKKTRSLVPGSVRNTLPPPGPQPATRLDDDGEG